MVIKGISLNSNTAYSVGVGFCLGAVAAGVITKLPQLALFKGKKKEELKNLTVELPEEADSEGSDSLANDDNSSVSSDNVYVDYMSQACTLATKNLLKQSGGPFGCVIVRDGKVIGEGANSVTTSKDPTCHAEMNAIRDACKNVDDFVLDGAICFTSCEPCPMCYAALRWARIDHIYFANTRKDAHDIGFSDQDIYDEIEKKNQKMERLTSPVAKDAFNMWSDDTKFVRY